LAESGRVAEALTYQRALSDLHPDDFETLMQLGFMHRAIYQIEDAALAFRRAIRLAPTTPDPHEALAEMYLDAARYEEAISESKALLKLTPHSLAARDILSTAYFQQGEIGKALETTSEMVRLVPSDPLSHYKRGILFQQRGDWRNALNEFSRAYELAENKVERQEAESAIEALDQHQVRQIMMLAAEDRLFQMQLARDADEATRERGYFISPGAAALVAQMTSERMADWNDDSSVSHANAYSKRPQLYN
jgi:tetratricopeptide (TPR) repeat protein